MNSFVDRVTPLALLFSPSVRRCAPKQIEPLSDNFARSWRNAHKLKRSESESVGIAEEEDRSVASFEVAVLMVFWDCL